MSRSLIFRLGTVLQSNQARLFRMEGEEQGGGVVHGSLQIGILSRSSLESTGLLLHQLWLDMNLSVLGNISIRAEIESGALERTEAELEEDEVGELSRLPERFLLSQSSLPDQSVLNQSHLNQSLLNQSNFNQSLLTGPLNRYIYLLNQPRMNLITC